MKGYDNLKTTNLSLPEEEVIGPSTRFGGDEQDGDPAAHAENHDSSISASRRNVLHDDRTYNDDNDGHSPFLSSQSSRHGDAVVKSDTTPAASLPARIQYNESGGGRKNLSGYKNSTSFEDDKTQYGVVSASSGGSGLGVGSNKNDDDYDNVDYMENQDTTIITVLESIDKFGSTKFDENTMSTSSIHNNNEDITNPALDGSAGASGVVAAANSSQRRITTAKSLMHIFAQRERYEDLFAWERDPYAASPDSKYNRYELPVSHDEGDRALEIKMNSCKRPHMRAFHCAWISFFLAFTIWFAPAPLLKEIGDTLHLSKQDLWTSSIANDVAAIVFRVVIGPVVDNYGARIPMAIVLVAASIPCSMVGLVNSARGLATVRFFIGFAGCSFVMSQFWPSRMFAREISGTANGIIGGWGNFGGAFTQLMMGRILFPLFKNEVFDGNPEPSWRLICIFPAIVAFCWGCTVWFISDDAPSGNYSKMRKSGTMDRLYFTVGIRSGVRLNTIVLYIQYACCFGVEIVMNNGAVLYFTDQFNLTTEDASLIAFGYGSMNLVFRGLGGYLSDSLNLRFGLRGRLWLQTSLLLLEGIVIIIFSYLHELHSAIIAMIFFSIFTQAAEGAIFGVVPYINKLYTGSIAGIVGSGGNVGSVVYGFVFRNLPYRQAFLVMGCCVVVSSLLTVLLRIPCHASMLWGEDNIAVINTRNKFLAMRDRHNIEQGTNVHGPNAACTSTGNVGDSSGGSTTATAPEIAAAASSNRFPSGDGTLGEAIDEKIYENSNNNDRLGQSPDQPSTIYKTKRNEDEDFDDGFDRINSVKNNTGVNNSSNDGIELALQHSSRYQ